MKHKDSVEYRKVQKLSDIDVSELRVKPNTPILTTPFTEKNLKVDSNGVEVTMYSPEDIAFINTSNFTEVATYFKKNGVYTKAHPIYDKIAFTDFWDREEDRRINGMSAPGKLLHDDFGTPYLQEIHITGEHYGYLNYSHIKKTETKVEKGLIQSLSGESLAKSNVTRGSTKEVSFPDFWDADYYFFKAVELARAVGLHLVVGKARRKGYSYKNGWIVANQADMFRNTVSVVGAYDEASLTDDGTMNKVKQFLDHINIHTDWNKGTLADTLDHIHIGYRYKGETIQRGFNSHIMKTVLRTNPGGFRGKDANVGILEEAGKCVNLAEIIEPTIKSFSDGTRTTGLFIVFGTGGGKDSYWQAFEDLFYKTYMQKFITFENIYDKDLSGTGCGYFHPAYLSKPGLIDIYGNSLIQEVVNYEEKERDLKRGDISKLVAHQMEEPFSPSEAFSRSSNAIMPTVEIEEQLRKLNYGTEYTKGREGIFTKSNSKLEFQDRTGIGNLGDDFIPPNVDKFPLEDVKNVDGCWVIFDQPYRNPRTGEIPEGLYRAWNDPYAISKDKDNFSIKDSLATTIIYEKENNFTKDGGDKIVAMFVGRREDTADYDKQMFYGVEYYDATLLFENDRGDVYTNARVLGYLDRLADEPNFYYNKDLQKGGQGRKKGMSIATNVQRKMKGAIYIKQWLLKKRGEYPNGKPIYNLNLIKDKGLLRELLKFDFKTNTDRVMALMIGMFDMRELLWSDTFDGTDGGDIGDTLATDPYFSGGLF